MVFEAPYRSRPMTVESKWIDYNGHLNMAYYNVLFDRCVDQVFELLGVGLEYVRRERSSLFTVEAHVSYLGELVAGDTVRATYQLLDFDDKRLHAFQELVDERDRVVAATSEHIHLHVDLASRRAAPFPAAVLDTVGAMRRAHAALPVSDRVGRSIRMKPRRN